MHSTQRLIPPTNACPMHETHKHKRTHPYMASHRHLFALTKRKTNRKRSIIMADESEWRCARNKVNGLNHEEENESDNTFQYQRTVCECVCMCVCARAARRCTMASDYKADSPATPNMRDTFQVRHSRVVVFDAARSPSRSRIVVNRSNWRVSVCTSNRARMRVCMRAQVCTRFERDILGNAHSA